MANISEQIRADHAAFMERQRRFHASMSAFAAMANRRAITSCGPIDTGLQHGPNLSVVDCGCGWGQLCLAPDGQLCGATPYHGRRGFEGS